MHCSLAFEKMHSSLTFGYHYKMILYICSLSKVVCSKKKTPEMQKWSPVRVC
jgi:hypothetical protein